MKRIVILTYDYPPNNGGIARLCGEIVNQCKLQGKDYLVVTCVDGPVDEKTVRIIGKRPWNDFRILHYLRRNLTNDDVILTGTFHPDGLLAYLSGHKCYFLGHGAEFLEGEGVFRKKIWPLYRRWLLTKPIDNISNSHYTAGLIKKCSPKASVTPIPLAVDHIRFKPTQKKYNDGLLHLCSVSRLEKFKAQDFVIETISNLPDSYKNKIRFEIAGKGSYKEQLEKLVKENHLEGIVSFLGFVSDEELCDLYSRNDIFILTTREINNTMEVEGFGLVFTEAQACGTACIGSLSGGIPDAIERSNGGWLIEQDNEGQLRELLISMIDNHSIVEEQCQKARLRIETKCNWQIYTHILFEYITKE